SRAQSISAAGLGFGVLALLWSSSGIFSAVRKGLNAAAHRKTSRPFWHAKLLDIALVPALGILIILSVGLAAATDVLIERVGSLGPLDFDTNLALRISGYVLPGVVTFSMFALLYRYVPTARPIWSEALSGALFATALFELAKNLYAFAFSLTAFSTDTAIYAGFGTVLGFLLWLFMNASILLLGAEFGRALIRPEWREHADAETEAAALAADVSRPEALPQTPARRHGRVS
ncbi:MAG: YihY/virulence factor BrkB family protein, partial [Tepidiformaceae bacterium]